MNAGTIKSLRQALKLHDDALRSKQSIMKARTDRDAPVWALTENMTRHLEKLKRREFECMSLLEEYCDSITTLEVIAAINAGKVAWA
jgi:hypothetical protein